MLEHFQGKFHASNWNSLLVQNRKVIQDIPTTPHGGIQEGNGIAKPGDSALASKVCLDGHAAKVRDLLELPAQQDLTLVPL